MPAQRKTSEQEVPEDTPARKSASLEDYRIEEFVRMGFSHYQASVLANLNSVYRSASWVRESFLKKGCSLEYTWYMLGNDEVACPN